MSLFTIIRNQIISNEVFGKEQKFKFKAFNYPQNAIVWMTKQKAFKVAKVERNPLDNGYVYTIHYKDVFTGCDYLNNAYEALKYKMERAERKGYIGKHSNEMVTTKFGNINDKFRTELDCPNYENHKDFYEYLDKADDCTFELFIQSIGYENYQDFVVNQEAFQSYTDEDIDRMYREFLERIETRDYASGYIY